MVWSSLCLFFLLDLGCQFSHVNGFFTISGSGRKLPAPRHSLYSSGLEASLDGRRDVTTTEVAPDAASLKMNIIRQGAFLDRGNSYNPTSGSYYSENMDLTREYIESLCSLQSSSSSSSSSSPPLSALDGEWELVFSTVPHGLFRSSPFFLAVQDAFRRGSTTTAFGQDKAELFFKLHELQTCSWGVSKVGRIAQRISAEEGVLHSEFDTSLFSLTTVPLVGWGKVLPTFGGSVVTKSDITDCGSTVRNITFRDCHMPDTYKGIYMKFRDGSDGLIEDVTFENIVIDRPTQWPIWIGPAQQSDSNNPCAAHPCSICWPDVPLAKCSPSGSRYNNILLKNVTINSPAVSSSPSPRPSSPSSSPSPTPSSPPRARTPPSPQGDPILSSSGATA